MYAPKRGGFWPFNFHYRVAQASLWPMNAANMDSY